MMIGQLWNDDINMPPLPLYKDFLDDKLFSTKIFPSLQRVPVQFINNKEAIVGNLKFKVLLFPENQRK
jgi:hypothetical protein